MSNASGSTFNQSAGDIIIDGNDNFATGTSVASSTPMLGFGTSSLSFSTGTINLTGGAITFVDPHVATTAGSGYTIYAYLASGMNFDAAAAHTIKFGNGVSTQQGGNTNGFYYYLYAGSGRLNLGSVIVNNPSGTNRNVTQYISSGIMNGDLTVTAGTYSQNALQTNIGGNLTVANGAVLGGTGGIKGTVTINPGGKIQPGVDGIGILTDSTGVTLLSGAIAEMDINPSAKTNDLLKVTGGNITLNGTLSINTLGSGIFKIGDSFKLFEANTYSGNFS
ncbi:MAG: hypothetical protein EOP51_30925, partial [Sphingobacteriales bacterium]